MSKKKKASNDASFELPNDGFFTSSVASANECTGYAVTVPETAEQAESYSDLVGVSNTQSTKEKKKKQKPEQKIR